MNKPNRRKAATLILITLVVSLPPSASAAARQREHLTDEEIVLVQENQEIDKRTAVFIKAAERRLLAVTNPEEAAKQSAKDKEQWGEVKGTRAQLFYDISKVLDEAVTNVDDAALHNPGNPRLRKSLFMLAEAVARMRPQLDALRAKAQDQAEADNLDRAVETAKEIADAARERGVNAADMKTETEKDAKDKKASKDSKSAKKDN
jgi:hypothetical protein